MKSLNEFVRDNSKWVPIEDGKPYTGIFKGYSFFNKDVKGELVEVVRYTIEDIRDGKVRNLDSASASLAKQMANIEIGETIKMTRTGKSFDTKWKIEAMGGTKQSQSEIPVIEDEEPILNDDGEITEEELQQNGL